MNKEELPKYHLIRWTTIKLPKDTYYRLDSEQDLLPDEKVIGVKIEGNLITLVIMREAIDWAKVHQNPGRYR